MDLVGCLSEDAPERCEPSQARWFLQAATRSKSTVGWGAEGGREARRDGDPAARR